MTAKPQPFLPILLIAIFAVGSSWMVESPPYAVSDVHECLVFALGVFGWLYVGFAVLRQSTGGYTSGTAFLYLTLLCGLFPDLWLRWPVASLVGLAISLKLRTVFWKALDKRDLRREMAVLTSVIALTPIAVLPYYRWPGADNIIVAAIVAMLIGANAIYIWFGRQRFSTHGLFTWLFFGILTLFLVTCTYTGWLKDQQYRLLVEPVMLFMLLLVVALFTADLLRVEQQLRRGAHLHLDASLKDPLTGLANRRAMELHAPQIIQRSHDSGRAVSLIISDIDHFKQINDLHGHLAGDTVLRQAAQALTSQVRKSDLVVRYGGEEFVVILPGSPLAPALRLAERMRAAVESLEVDHEGRQHRLTMSFGVVTAFPEEPVTLSEMMERADSNLYRAKRSGRNKVMTDELPGPGL